MRTVLVILLAASAVLLLGGVAFATRFLMTAPEAPAPAVESSTEEKRRDTSAAGYGDDPKAYNAQERRSLTMSYQDKIVGSFPDVTKEVAQDFCSLVVREGVCAWGTELVTESATLEEHIASRQFEVSLSPETDSLTYGLQYHVRVSDPGASSPSYRMFVVHKDLLGRVNGIYEAHITAETAPQRDARTFEWYLEEQRIDEHGETVVNRLKEGHYEVAVVDAATGRMSGFTKRFRIGSGAQGLSDTIAYGAGTPLERSYWDGRSLFFDGAGGEDTMSLIGTMAMYDIFKGRDLPKKGHLDTLVFLQNGNVVIISVNVEIISFDDVTMKTDDLERLLAANGGVLYRTEKFKP